jgi:uncharacterized protein YkwD
MRAAAAILFAALVLAPAGFAAPQASETGIDGRLHQTSYDASPVWQRIAQWPLSKDWHAPAAVASTTQRQSTTQQQTTLVSALVRGINDVRQQHGLKPFVTSAKLSTAAAQHTREMGVVGYFEHESADSTPFWKRVERWYPSKGWRSWSVGENLLYSSPDITASDGVDLWMNSPPHRANLLNRTWREIGISAIHFDDAPGEYDGQPVTIVTADFGARR